jgi:hypothetical protein
VPILRFQLTLTSNTTISKDQAFAWLEKAYNQRSSWMTWLKVEPKFDPLRSDERFEVLMRRVVVA